LPKGRVLMSSGPIKPGNKLPKATTVWMVLE